MKKQFRQFFIPHSLWLDILCISSICIAVAAYIFPLFYPTLMLFATPDSVLSDILHFNYPLKYLLSQSLKTGTFPLWTDSIGTGFPLIGEGQIQAFSLIHIILFKYFSLPVAFNLGYAVMFLFLGIGMYIVGREFKWPQITSLFISFLWMFGGLVIVKLPHYNNIAALSYLPILFWIILRTYHNPKTKTWLLLPFFLSQQIFQGHYQYIFMSWLFLLLFFFFFLWKDLPLCRHMFIKKGIVIILITIGLSAIQLIPSFEYFSQSLRMPNAKIPVISVNQSLSFSHFLQFINPYILGDIRNGTYPVLSLGTTFWETFSYIGIIPFLFALLSLQRISNTSIKRLWMLIGIFSLLSLGTNSPIYPLFGIPPFSWFPMHSRYIAIITFILILLFGYTFTAFLSYFRNKKILSMLPFVILIFTFWQLWQFGITYNPLLPVKDIQTTPELLTFIDKTNRIIDFESTEPWYEEMYRNGWTNKTRYLTLLNGGQPNYQVIQGITNFSMYSGYGLKKADLFASLLSDSILFDKRTKIASFSSFALTNLQLHNTSYVITPYTITNPEITLLKKTTNPNATFFLYEVSGVKPRYYLSYKNLKVATINEYFTLTKNPSITSQHDAFITTNMQLKNQSAGKGSVTTILDTPTKKIFTITSDKDVFFIASIYLYPGWEAYIDGEKTSLYPANVTDMALFTPKGTHKITLVFSPKSIFIGKIISIGSFICYLSMIILFLHQKKEKKDSSHIPSRTHSRTLHT